MRANHETIALLYHATGTGKTVTAVSDAKRLGGRTLFLAHTKELVAQAHAQFKALWPEVGVGIQSVPQPLSDFGMGEFDSAFSDGSRRSSPSG